eukprot:CAMPEP_0195306140 /NCGR_PEP_ID=MMETSP0707-20130614/37048_1 /TAXON_ID=33640 /ORGANISM="Asterionellopsis glacialis, Strain CCMP134" /LENGTH=296 /DNA_ID=CAMNT_0040370349 /DNA_START=188 /DNA_END=1078 /DNA_ORIENTATION=-
MVAMVFTTPKSGGRCMSAVLVLTLLSGILEFAYGSSDEGEDCLCTLLPQPSADHKEETARWMVHSLDWGVLSTISTRVESVVDENGAQKVVHSSSSGTEADSKPVPFGNIYSFVDGVCDDSTGTPYFLGTYMDQTVPFGNIYSFVDGVCDDATGTPYFLGTYMDQSFSDTLSNSAISLSLTEASIPSVCGTSPLKSCEIAPTGFGDPENPVCARLVLSGILEALEPGTDEYLLAQKGLYQRHPSMAHWPKDHEWVFAKLNIQDIWLIDYFGGASILDVDAYYSVDLTSGDTSTILK